MFILGSSVVLAFIFGAVVGTVLARARLVTAFKLKEAEAARLSDEAQHSKTAFQTLDAELRQIERVHAGLQARNLILETELKSWHEESERKFEHLALSITQKNSEHLQKNSEKSLSTMLEPFKERLKDLQKKVEDTYQSEARERFALKTEIEKIVRANEVMTQETQNLTRALKGDVKAQGNWGEVILERILEASGLRAGEEYIVQGTGMGLKNSDGAVMRPDVILRLPEGKHLIIDSKVSLVHYERIVALASADAHTSSDPDTLPELSKRFQASLEAHITGLSDKNYQDLEGLGSPDFVLMFVPIEGAFSMALQFDPTLFTRAWDHHVVVVSPTTLLATLRTIAALWKQERQTRNALEIARVGGALYEKFVGFVEDLNFIDTKLGDTREALTRAMGKLSQGKGNLIARVEHLKKLGAKTSKTIPLEWEDSP